MRRILSWLMLHAALIAVAALTLAPLVWMVSASLMPAGDATTTPPPLLPRRVTLEHYLALFTRLDLGRCFLNSALITISTTAFSVLVNAMAGYAFATSGDAAHCKKPAYTDQRSLAACPLGFPTFRADRLDSKDMCAGTNPVTGEVLIEPGCKAEDLTAGYTKRIVRGNDFCGKLIPQQIQAPSRAAARYCASVKPHGSPAQPTSSIPIERRFILRFPECQATSERCTSCTTPGGSPVRARISNSRTLVSGVFSLGFRMKQLPQATA